MRNINIGALLELQKSWGVEPTILLRVFWNGDTGATYSERVFSEHGFLGKILNMSGIEDVLNISSSNSSASVTVTLDDTDETLKQLFDTVDIHKTRCQILQWFVGLSPDDAFVIFTGEISSPVVWKESDRTLSFTILTKLEDKEIGYSIEEGTITNYPQSFTGKPWPLVFGTVADLPILKITDGPVLILEEGLGTVNEDVWTSEIGKLQASLNEAYAQWYQTYLLGLGSSFRAYRYKVDFPQFGMTDDPDKAKQHDEAADNYFNQAAQYRLDMFRIEQEINAQANLFAQQKAVAKSSVKAYGRNLPIGTSLSFQQGEYIYSGIYTGSHFNLQSKQRVPDEPKGNAINNITQTQTLQITASEVRGNKFDWIDGGTRLNILNYPADFIVGLEHLNVLAVYGYQKGVPVALSPSEYNIVHQQTGSLKFTALTVFRALSTRLEEEWDDDQIYVNVSSPIGPNVVDIIIWAIQTFTDHEFDHASFGHVRALVDKYPANFYLLERKNIIQFFNEISFQSRMAIWLNDNKFFLRYLPEEQSPIETFGMQDLIVNSLEIGFTDTESLVTKFVAEWSYDSKTTNKIIYRYNVQKYGTMEESYDFYIYNSQDLVEKSAEFWTIRKANSFKIVQFKTGIHKLKVEALDPVLIDFGPLVADYPVTGIVQRATYNQEDNTIDMEVWLPVRVGEMVKYDFAYPKDVALVFPPNDDIRAVDGNPFADSTGQLTNRPQSPDVPQVTRVTREPWTRGRNREIGDQFDPPAPLLPENIRGLSPAEFNRSRPNGLSTWNDIKDFNVKPYVPFQLEPVTPNIFPGVVGNRREDGLYNVFVFTRGTHNPPFSIVVGQFFQHEDEVIPPGSPAVVYRGIYTLPDGTQLPQYFMQVPVWLSPQS